MTSDGDHSDPYRLLFERSPLPMWVFDRETLRFLDVNEQAVRQYGYDRDEFLSMTILDIRPADERPALVADLGLHRTGYDPPTEWLHCRKNGEVFHVEVSAHDMEHRGRPARLVLVRDMTERVRLRTELESYAARLETAVTERTRELADANAQLEAFVYSVSHDLRAPLRAMHGFSQVLIEDYGEALGEEGRRKAGRIIAAAQRMDHLIHDLLAYSRITKTEATAAPVSLDSAVGDARAQADLGERGAEVVVAGPLGVVMAHRETLVQVLVNLLSNGAKFVAPDRVPRLAIDAWQDYGEVHLRVRDNGIGIQPEYRERIFGIFQRLHPVDRFPGTGIGLAIVQRGVERMGGRVELESEVGEGSTFTVVLPAAPASD